MKTQYNHLTHCYETPDKTTVAAEICEGATPSAAFRAATIREQQRNPLTDKEIEFIYADTGYNDIQMFARAIEAAYGIIKESNDK